MGFGRVSYRRALWTLIAVGTAARLLVAFTTEGHGDIDSLRFAAISLDDAAHFYAHANRDVLIYPYPPGFLPFVQAAECGNAVTGASFAALVRLPAVAADAAIAWLVQHHLGRAGFGERDRLAGAALVALGPAFAAVSGYHGQFDSVAILPAVAALVLWERTDAPWRPYAVGALIGLGGAVKVVPLLMLLALLPSARSLAEAAKLSLTALAIPAIALAPFVLVDAGSVRYALEYSGRAGLGGLNLLADPSGPLSALHVDSGAPSELARTLSENSLVLLGPVLAATALLLLRRRPDPALAACVIWLAVYAAGVNMFSTYLVWGLPFFVLAGFLRQAAIVQAVVLPALVVLYVLVPARDDVTLHAWEVSAFYTAPMIALWAALTGAFFVLVRRM